MIAVIKDTSCTYSNNQNECHLVYDNNQNGCRLVGNDNWNECRPVYNNIRMNAISNLNSV